MVSCRGVIYDPETGRFLQPDPVHTDATGRDNWDRYQYVWNDPVNNTDPTGMRGNEHIHQWNQMLGAVSGNFNEKTRGLGRGYKDWAGGIRSGWNSFAKGAFHSANHFTGGAAHSFNSFTGGLVRGAKDFAGGARGSWNHWATGAMHSYNVFTGTNDFQAWVMYEMSGMTPEEFGLMWMVAYWAGSGFGEEDSTIFGHNYTGSGNKDPFARFNSKNGPKRNEALFKFIVAMHALRRAGLTQATDAEFVSFLGMIAFLSPGPVSFADSLAVGHDREVPGSQWDGPNSAHISADINWIRRWYNGMLDPNSGFWDKPLDSWVVGVGGSLLFGADAMLRCGVLGQIAVR